MLGLEDRCRTHSPACRSRRRCSAVGSPHPELEPKLLSTFPHHLAHERHTHSLSPWASVGASSRFYSPDKRHPAVCSVKGRRDLLPFSPSPLLSPSATHQSSSSDKSNPRWHTPSLPLFPFSMARRQHSFARRAPRGLANVNRGCGRGVDSPPQPRTRRLPPSLFLCSSVGPDVGSSCLPSLSPPLPAGFSLGAPLSVLPWSPP